MAHGLSPKPLRVTVACSSWTPNRSMVRPGWGVPFPPAFWNISSSSTSWSSRGERVRLKGVAWNWWRRLSSVLSSRTTLWRDGEGRGSCVKFHRIRRRWNTGRNSRAEGAREGWRPCYKQAICLLWCHEAPKKSGILQVNFTLLESHKFSYLLKLFLLKKCALLCQRKQKYIIISVCYKK